MTIVQWSPNMDGTQKREFRNVKRAVDFLKYVWQQDMRGFAYLLHYKHSKPSRLEQWFRGKRNYTVPIRKGMIPLFRGFTQY